MFFYLSKIGWFLFQPSNALILLATAGAVLTFTRWRRAGQAVLAPSLACLVVFGFTPLGHLLVLPLEERFPPAAEGPPPDGIIVLGGAFDTTVSAGRSVIALNEAAERLTEFAALARRYEQARLLFSGGSGAIIYDAATEADLAETLFESLGIAGGRIIYEGRSRNTWENALYSREEVAPEPGQRWILVTSAYHMPRAVGSFREAGFDVHAHPVDYRTRGRGDLTRPFYTFSEGLRRMDLAAREWAGLLAYRLTGRTDRLLPGPGTD